LPIVKISGSTGFPSEGEMLIAEPSPGAAAAGPDLVEDQRQAVLIAQLAHLRGEIRRIQIHAPFALDRLHDDPAVSSSTARASASISPAQPARIPGTIGSNPALTAGFPVAEIIASERPWKLLFSEMIFHRLGDCSAAAQARQFARRFVGLQSAVAEKRLAGKCALRASRSANFDLRLGVKRVADMPELQRLRPGRGDQFRMAMPQDRPAESGEKIDVFLARRVPEERTLAALHHHRLALVVADQDLGRRDPELILS
jgi:hypothetical protein